MSHRVPKLVFTEGAWDKLLYFVQMSPGEIGGWAYVERRDSSLLYVSTPDDLFITKQKVSAGSVDITKSTHAMAVYNAGLAGRSEDLHLQWHSHVHGAASFSSMDTDSMDAFEGGGTGWMVSVVLNKYGQLTARLDQYTPLRTSLDLMVFLERQRNTALREECIAAMTAHVTQLVYPDQPMTGFKKHLHQEPDEEPLTESDISWHDVREPDYIRLSR